MQKYIFNKMLSEKREYISGTIILTCIISVVIVCMQIAEKLLLMLQNDWYKNSIEVLLVSDHLIREKMGLIIGIVLVIVSIIFLFCVVVYSLKLKLDIVKERERISVYLVIGYTRSQVIMAIFWGKAIELGIASVFGVLLAYMLWKILCGQELFYSFMELIDKEVSFNLRFVIVCFVVFALIGFINISYNINRKVGLMDMKGGDGNE